VLQRGCDVVVGCVGAETQMPGPLFRVGDEFGESTVQSAPLLV
jgi:hypothetical protein